MKNYLKFTPLSNGYGVKAADADNTPGPEHIVIPFEHEGKAVVAIEEYGFNGCESLSSVIISNGVTHIGQGAFEACSNLQNVALPDSIKTIGAWAFQCCELRSVVIPPIQEIQKFTFTDCIYLTNITIPNTVKNIKKDAFSNTSLSDIYYRGTKEQWRTISKEDGWDRETNYYIIHCTDGDINKEEKP